MIDRPIATDFRRENDPAFRDLLHQAWRTIEEKIIGMGVPQGAAVQTMVTVAAEEFARAYGPDLAAEYFGAISSAFRRHTARWDELEELAREEIPLARTPSFPRRWRLPRMPWRASADERRPNRTGLA
jgi:hypothetical protein